MSTPALVIPSVSAFPPSFAGDEWAFGAALFSLSLLTMLPLSFIWQEVRVWRVHRDPLLSPIGIARMCFCLLLATIFSGASGDAATLLAWGEVSPRTMALIFRLDRLGDALCGPLFVAASLLFLYGRETIVYQLIRESVPRKMWPTWEEMRRQVQASAIMLLLAAGVALAK